MDWPPALDAVSRTRRIAPRSPSAIVYVLSLAVVRGTQTLVQRMSSVASEVTTGPLQVPGVMVTVAPTRFEPEISGSVRQRGPAVVATAVSAERAEAEPSTFVAVLTTTSAWPTSAATSVYCAPVAPVIGAHPPVSQRSQARPYAVSGLSSQV